MRQVHVRILIIRHQCVGKIVVLINHDVHLLVGSCHKLAQVVEGKITAGMRLHNILCSIRQERLILAGKRSQLKQQQTIERFLDLILVRIDIAEIQAQHEVRITLIRRILANLQATENIVKLAGILYALVVLKHRYSKTLAISTWTQEDDIPALVLKPWNESSLIDIVIPLADHRLEVRHTVWNLLCLAHEFMYKLSFCGYKVTYFHLLQAWIDTTLDVSFTTIKPKDVANIDKINEKAPTNKKNLSVRVILYNNVGN